MAAATLLKIKPNSKLPLQFLRNPISALIGPVDPISQSEVVNESQVKSFTFPLQGMTRNLFAGELAFAGVRNSGADLSLGGVFVRQMGTSRRKDDDDDDDDDYGDEDIEFDDDGDEGVDAFGEDEGGSEDYEDDEEEEKPKRKKRF
ncbi:hypothetical protein RIF29_31015 [Crotalaria pallida]|uniref:Uncharacterized protein n=1 Tax=Crotalaria pallida TaxID=3830 RepID=A0AAN9EH61_CROPI